MGFYDLYPLSFLIHFVRNAIWIPRHKQNRLISWSHFRGAARWLQGPPTALHWPSPLTEEPSSLTFSLCLALMPSQSQPLQGLHDRNHRRQKRWGCCEKGNLMIKSCSPTDCCDHVTRGCHDVCKRRFSWYRLSSVPQGWTKDSKFIPYAPAQT